MPMVSDRLQDWEQRFDSGLSAVEAGKRSKAGALLPIIPRHGEWEDFLKAVKVGWNDWQHDLRRYPASLLLLYGGLAFFEYDDRTFWPHFADAVAGAAHPPAPNRQTEINSVFQWAAQRYLLTLMYRRNGTDFVGSAVYQVGIPLSLWEGFLEICEWAAWRPDWKELSDAEWIDSVEKRAVNRPRLRRFLVDNRESASSFVQEILDVRYVLTQDQSLSASDIAQASVLRPEYFEEVPETADFLRPQNPESLFHDRATLVWNDRTRRLSVYLPAVTSNQLPATWRIDDHIQKASSSPDELLLNSAAFRRRLVLRLDSGQRSEVQLLRSPEAWGLFDLEAGGRLANSNREELPLKSYALLSLSPISFVSVEGFSRDESPENEPMEFSDGVTCYETRLWPTGPATCTVELVYRLKEVESCWKNLPGATIPWFLLCQTNNGMTWDELLLAKDAIAPDLQLSPYLLRKCFNEGLLVQRGQRWFIEESRAALSLAVRNEFELTYCGDPSVLWGLYRHMHQNYQGRDLPDIEVVDERGGIPYLRTRWSLRARPAIGDYLKGRGVVIAKDLWTH